MKGICHVWSRGRHFSPSLPGDRYLKLGSKSDLRAEISGSIVWYDALAQRPEVLRSFSPFYANEVSCVPFLRRCKSSRINSFDPFNKIEKMAMIFLESFFQLNYLNPSLQKRSPSRNLGKHCLVRRLGTTSRGPALLVFSVRIPKMFSPYYWPKNIFLASM